MSDEDTFDGAAPKETTERMVYCVPSYTKTGRSYRVDLTANGGYSQCECTDWSTRRWPAIKAGRPMGTRATLCCHGLKARRHFLNGLLVAMAQSEGGGV